MTCENCEKLGRAIDEQSERITDLDRELRLKDKFIGEWREQRDKLAAALRLACARLSICLDRFLACNENDPGAHLVAIEQMPAWLEEHQKLLDEVNPPDVKEMWRRSTVAVLNDKSVDVSLKRRVRLFYEEAFGETVDGIPVSPPPTRSER